MNIQSPAATKASISRRANPAAALRRLGVRFDEAIVRERNAYAAADLDATDANDIEASEAWGITHDIVRHILDFSAETVDGVQLQIRALLWRAGFEIGDDDAGMIDGWRKTKAAELAVEQTAFGSAGYEDLVSKMLDEPDPLLVAQPATAQGYAAKADALMHLVDILVGGPDGLPSIAAVRADLALIVAGADLRLPAAA